jgi:hypothetical protein
MSSPNLRSGRCRPSRRSGWANGPDWWTSIFGPQGSRGPVGSGASVGSLVLRASRLGMRLLERRRIGGTWGSPFIWNASPCCSGPQVSLHTMRRSGRGCFRARSIFFRGPIEGRVTGGLAALGDGMAARPPRPRSGRSTPAFGAKPSAARGSRSARSLSAHCNNPCRPWPRAWRRRQNHVRLPRRFPPCRCTFMGHARRRPANAVGK